MTRVPFALVAVMFACRGSTPIHEDEATPSSRSEPAPAPAPELDREAAKAQLEERLAGIEAGEEREIADGVFMTVYRSQATDPLGDGWQRAASTGGGFSVELPIAFNDFMSRAQATDQVEARSHSVGGKTPGLLTWAATCMARRDGKLGPEGRAGGLDETKALGTPTTAYSRTIEFDDMHCFLIVEAQGTDPLPPEADRNRFLQSFVRTGAPVW